MEHHIASRSSYRRAATWFVALLAAGCTPPTSPEVTGLIEPTASAAAAASQDGGRKITIESRLPERGLPGRKIKLRQPWISVPRLPSHREAIAGLIASAQLRTDLDPTLRQTLLRLQPGSVRPSADPRPADPAMAAVEDAITINGWTDVLTAPLKAEAITAHTGMVADEQIEINFVDTQNGQPIGTINVTGEGLGDWSTDDNAYLHTTSVPLSPDRTCSLSISAATGHRAWNRIITIGYTWGHVYKGSVATPKSTSPCAPPPPPDQGGEGGGGADATLYEEWCQFDIYYNNQGQPVLVTINYCYWRPA